MNNSEVKAVAYARVSTLLGQNPDNQLVNIRQFCKGRSFNLINEYTDTGVSGSKERRPALDDLIADARRGKFKILVVTAIDRVARDTRHLLNFIQEMSHYNVSLISLRENIDFSTPFGQAALTIIGAIAQLERELIRERIKTSLAAKKLTAERLGTNWKCGRPIIVSPQIEQSIFELKAQGNSIRAIASRLGISKSSVQKVLKEASVQKP